MTSNEEHRKGVQRRPKAWSTSESPRVQHPTPTKRNRYHKSAQEQAPAKRKNKTNQGKKPQTNGNGNGKEKEEKKSLGSTQIVRQAGGTSPQQPGKKAQHFWSDKDEITFVSALLGCSDVPKNMAQVLKHIRGSLEYDYSKVQLYKKMRRLKNKHQTIRGKLKQGHVSFKNPHERNLFNICEQLWNEDEKMQETDGKVFEEGDAGSPQHGERNPMHSAQQNGKIALVTGNGNENMGFISQLTSDCKKMIEDAQSNTLAFIEATFKAAVDRLQRRPGGTCSCTVSLRGNKKLMDGMYSVKEFPVLDSAAVETLEQKWRRQYMIEMEMFSRRLDIWQEECRMSLEGLKTPTGTGRP